MKKLVSIIVLFTLLLMNSVSVLAVTQDQITSQRTQVQNLTNEIATLDSQVNTLETQIATLNTEIEETIQKLYTAQEEEAELKEASKDRVRAAYMYGTGGYLELLFSAENPSDFISYYDVTKDILKADKSSLEELKKKREEIEKLQQQQIKDRQDLVNKKREAEATRSVKQTLLSTNQELVAQLEELMRVQNLNNQNAQPSNTPFVDVTNSNNNVQAQSSNPNVLIQGLNGGTEAQNPEIQAQSVDSSSAMVLPGYAAESTGTEKVEDETNENNNYMVDIPSADGTYITIPTEEVPNEWYWPLDANGGNAFTITSLMGTRESPGGIGSTDHQGTDIGADYGTAVLAAQSGTVKLAGTYGGYGNAVVIDHGNGYTTTYGHLSSVAVKEGEQVQGGQIIGFVGSTGFSTGPHLHFEVHYTDDTGTDSVINGLSLYGDDIYQKLTFLD